jgi:hypothetical protein
VIGCHSQANHLSRQSLASLYMYNHVHLSFILFIYSMHPTPTLGLKTALPPRRKKAPVPRKLNYKKCASCRRAHAGVLSPHSLRIKSLMLHSAFKVAVHGPKGSVNGVQRRASYVLSHGEHKNYQL